MVSFRTLSAAAALMTCSLAPALAQNQPLDVRTGLWEFSTQREMTGMPKMPKMPALPPEVLAKMPPAQRAQLEAALKARRNAGSGKHVSKVCITAESLRKGPNFGMARELNCKRTQNVSTAQGWHVQEVCRPNGRKQIMDIDYKVVTREAIEGAVHIAMQDGARNITMNQTSRGRWLGPDCGDVKPLD
jgi:hypothetical protein